MATGVDFMLKSLGINPDDIQKQMREFQQTVLEFATALRRVEAKQDLILQNLGVSNDGQHGNGKVGPSSDGPA